MNESEPSANSASDQPVSKTTLSRLRWLWVVVATAIAWPETSLAGQSGIDPGEMIGMHRWRQLGLDYANELHTHGPLDYLFHPKAIGLSSIGLPLVFLLIVSVATALTLRSLLRRNFGEVSSIVLTTAIMFLAPDRYIYSALWVFVLLFAVALLSLTHRDRFAYWPEVLASSGALFFYAKPSLGVGALAMSLVVGTIAYRSPTSVLRSIACAAVVIVAVWLLLGEHLSQLGGWLGNTRELISGFTRSFGLADDGKQTLLTLLICAVSAGCIVYMAFFADDSVGDAEPGAASREASRVRLARVLLTLVTVYLVCKEVFTRSDSSHLVGAFAILPVLLALVVFKSKPWLPVVVLVSFAVSINLFGRPVPSSAVRSVVTFGRTVAYAVDAPAREHAEALYVERLRNRYRLPSSIRTALADKPVTLDFEDAGVAWAYGLNWHPAPVWQKNLAYTPALDEINAKFLATQRPYVLLNDDVPTDGRARLHENPSWYRELLCNYRLLAADGSWQVLEPSIQRCSAPRLLSSTVVRSAGDVARVPAAASPNGAVYASMKESTYPVWKQAFYQLFKYPKPPAEKLNGKNRPLVAATAGGPLLLDVPASAGWSFFADRPPAKRDPVKTISLANVAYPVTLQFYELDLTPIP